MKTARIWNIATLMAILLLLAILIQPAQSAFQGVDLTDSEGNVIGMLFEDTPVLVTSQTETSARIIIAGFVEPGFAEQNNSMSAVEGFESLQFGDLQFQDVFGTSVRLIGIIQSDAERCFGSLTLEVSLWDAEGQLMFVLPFNVWQVSMGAIAPFRTDRISATLSEANEFSVRIRFIGGTPCSQSTGGGGGGVDS